MHASNVLFWFAIIMLIAAAYLYARKEGLNDDKNAVALNELLGRLEKLETMAARTELTLEGLGGRVDAMDKEVAALRDEVQAARSNAREAGNVAAEARAAGNVLAKNLGQKIEWLEVKIKALKHARNSDKKQVEISLDPVTLDKILKKPVKKK